MCYFRCSDNPTACPEFAFVLKATLLWDIVLTFIIVPLLRRSRRIGPSGAIFAIFSALAIAFPEG